MKQACNKCIFKDDNVKQGKDESRLSIFCLYNSQWHQDSYYCANWTEQLYKMSRDEKLRQAFVLRQKDRNRYADTVKTQADSVVLVAGAIVIALLLAILIIAMNKEAAFVWK